ncbi:glycosyltransferase [Neptuniibacter sp. SY11_33]|uniref:glycosyltransferase n=1 Tax=Neptuniibacter sp. SY11_33 TaxID=3398215 RepID=UPI0039F549D2
MNSPQNQDDSQTSNSVSAVVCSWNAADSIVACLKSLRENGVYEIILVDADSEDGTQELAKPYVDCILQDQRQGLGAARNLGIEVASGRFILNCGCDNIMPPGSVRSMLDYMSETAVNGVSAVTHLQPEGYLSRSLNEYKKTRFFPGVRNYIGTPSLFPAAKLKSHPFDPTCSWSDDSELCDRWRVVYNAKFAISDSVIYESNPSSLSEISARWKNYGRSDFEIYTKNGPDWSIGRKIQSLLYPFREELIKPFIKIKGLQRFTTLPFLIYITSSRYIGWAKCALRSSR